MAAVTAMATLPCIVLFAQSHDDIFVRFGKAVRSRWPRRLRLPGFGWRERRRLTRLDRAFGSRAFGSRAAPATDPACPPIEKIAADLRRLRRHRTGIALRSPVWFAAVEKAYDDRLALACDRLGIATYLDDVTGMDREAERMRLEAALEAAGLRLRGFEAVEP
jgi:hypothetical protein